MILRYILGIGLISLGVIGLFLPILQGILMIFAGLLIVKPELAQRLKARFTRKHVSK